MASRVGRLHDWTLAELERYERALWACIESEFINPINAADRLNEIYREIERRAHLQRAG